MVVTSQEYVMEAIGTFQGTAASPARAPQAPVVPPLPPRPGAATGAGSGTSAPSPVALTDVRTDVRTDVQNDVQNDVRAALREARDEIRAAVQGTQTPQAGEPVIVVPPPYRSDIPPEVIPIVGMVSGTLIALVIGYPIVRLITRLIERRTDRTMMKGSEVTAQLRTLQESVDTMAIELERISEAQRFSAKLLAERSEQR